MPQNNPEGMVFPGLYDDKVKAVLDVDNDLVIEDTEHCIYMGSEGLLSFYTWLGDHLEARGILIPGELISTEHWNTTCNKCGRALTVQGVTCSPCVEKDKDED